MKIDLEHYGYSVRYMDLTGELYDETRKGFSSKEYAEKNLNDLVSDLKAENEIIDARIHAYQALPQIIYVIGSRKFVSEIKQKQDEYSLRGYIVIDNTFDQENLNQLPSEIRNEFSLRIRQTGFFKIRIADLIYVVNKNGYIGEGTGEKILVANSLGKDIVYLEAIH